MLRLRPASWKMRRLTIIAAPNVIATARIWIVCIVGIAQKVLPTAWLSGVFENHTENSSNGVDLSHWANANNRSPIDAIDDESPLARRLAARWRGLTFALWVIPWADPAPAALIYVNGRARRA